MSGFPGKTSDSLPAAEYFHAQLMRYSYSPRDDPWSWTGALHQLSWRTQAQHCKRTLRRRCAGTEWPRCERISGLACDRGGLAVLKHAKARGR